MNSRTVVAQVFYFIVYITLQMLILRNIVLFDVAFCYIYVAFLLMLPFDTNKILVLFYGLITGMILDIFYDSLGIHTAASVLIMYLRTIWINLITPRGGYELDMRPTLKSMGFEWFTTYTLPLILLHHFALFYIEAGGFSLFFFTFSKVISSTVFTFITIVIIQYLFYRPGRSY